MLNKISTLAIVVFAATTTSFAQMRSIVFEPVAIHSGAYADGVNLDGYITFDMYAYMTNETDILEKIYSIDDGTPGTLDASDTHFDFLGNVFQHEMAGHTGAMNDCGLWGANPSMQFDSYMTFDDTTQCAIDNPFNETMVIPDAATVISTFEGPANGNYFDGGNFWMDDGELWRVCDPELPTAGPDLKIRIARITTNNSFSGYLKTKTCCFNTCTPPPIDMFCQDTIIVGMDTTFVLCSGGFFACNFECYPNLIDNTVLIEEEIQCYGETATVAIGNGETPYSISNTFTNEEVSVGSLNPTYQLPFGCYSVVFEDDEGCVGAGATCIFQPPPLEISAEGIGTSCGFGWDGSICITASGGTPPYTYSSDYGGSGNDPCIYGLPCGTYEATVTDANGCTESTIVDVWCGDYQPEIQVVDLQPESCPGACDGSMSVDVYSYSNWTLTLMDDFGNFIGGADGFGFDSFLYENLCAGGYNIEVWAGPDCFDIAYVEIEGGEGLTYQATPGATSCPGACDGTLALSPDAGMNWSFEILFDGNPYSTFDNVNAGDLLFVEDLCAGDYEIIPSTPDGCAPPSTVTIEEGEEPEVAFFWQDDICAGECIGFAGYAVISGGDPLDFTCYDDLGNTYDPNVLCAGNYTCQVSFAGGCFAEETFEIVEGEIPVIIPATTTDIPGGDCDGAVEFEIIGGVGPFFVECFDEDLVSYDGTALCAGDYDCWLTDVNGCVFIAEVVIEEGAGFSADISSSDVTCSGWCDGFLCVENVSTPCGGPVVVDCSGGTYTPDGCDSNPGFFDLCPGEYTITVTDTECGQSMDFGPFVISEPPPFVISILTQDVTCAGAGDGTIEVSCSGGNEPVVIDPPGAECPTVITGLSGGEYIYTATDAAGCISEFNAVINEPEPLFLVPTTTAESCAGACDGTLEVEVFGGQEPYIVLVDGDPIELVGGNMCAGSYEVCVFDLAGCMYCELVEIDSPPGMVINIQTNKSTCEGMFDGSAQFLIQGGEGEYQITLNPEDIDLNALQSGEYEIHVVDENQCEVSESFVIEDEFERFLIDVLTTPETCWNTKDGMASAHTFGGVEPFSYLWDDPLQQITPIAHSLEAYAEYTVEITDGNGCVQGETITFEPSEGCFFVSTGITPNGDGSNDHWLIGGLDQFPEASVQVYNRWGQLIYESRGYADPWDGTYNNRKVAQADYFYVITYQDDLEPLTGTISVKY